MHGWLLGRCWGGCRDDGLQFLADTDTVEALDWCLDSLGFP